ncbi:MAG TPA: Ppx/GppA family phosphatase, partial [Candidatus Eisenbacteria bacterium]|nr:Ppx/GppA family phosphatase [Candidatus Eisenbacteria bacterium]
DIGGGSSEFIRGNDAGVSAAISIDMGSVRLTERFFHSDPVAPAEAQTMISAIDRELAALPSRGIDTSSGVALVGIAATFTTLAAMEKRLITYSHPAIHGSRITARQVRAQVSALQMKTIAERKGIIGLDPKRAEVIFAGACLIDRILSFYGKDEVVVSDQGVRYGLLHEAAEAMQKG